MPQARLRDVRLGRLQSSSSQVVSCLFVGGCRRLGLSSFLCTVRTRGIEFFVCLFVYRHYLSVLDRLKEQSVHFWHKQRFGKDGQAKELRL
jgi:hypothetical protein